MLECAAFELGRWQGKLYAEKPSVLSNIQNLRKADCLINWCNHCWSLEESRDVFDYLRESDCDIPKHLREMLLQADENADKIIERLDKLPIVMGHGDFWFANIFYVKGTIVLVDWDCAGWSYLGEDASQLITDEVDAPKISKYACKFAPAYYKGFSEYADISGVDYFIREMLPVILGISLIKHYQESETADEKALQIDILQQIYEMREMDV
jgi:hypothetical protein